MIREAELSDMPRLLAMAEAFHDASGVPLPYDGRKVAEVLRALLAADDAAAFVWERGGEVRGMLLCAATPCLFGPARIAEEVAFWIDPEARGGSAARRLIGAFEAWARERGATVVGLVDPGGCAALYERAGYRRAETRYMRAV